MFVPQNAVSSANFDEVYHYGLFTIPNGMPQEAVIRFKTDNAAQAKFIVTGNNPYGESVNDFVVSDPFIAPCPE